MKIINLSLLMSFLLLSGCLSTGSKNQIVVEAEDMKLSVYELEEKAAYSSGVGVMINTKTNAFQTGTAEYTFQGVSGIYSIDITYVDEAEPLAPLDERFADYSVEIVRSGDVTEIDRWTADQELPDHTISEKTLTVRMIKKVDLKAGDII